MQVSEITLYNILKSKFGEQDAQSVVEGIKQEVKSQVDEHKDILASKLDISALEIKIAQMEARLTMRMFYFWIGQVGAIAGLMAYFFKTH
jgi:energy-converting hydrogenase A subunit M